LKSALNFEFNYVSHYILLIKNVIPKTSASTDLYNELHCDKNLQHMSPRFLINSNNSHFSFESNRSRLLVTCSKANLYQIKADQIILFDETWKDFVPLDDQMCKYIIICDAGQQEAYERMNESKEKLLQIIDTQCKTRVDTLSIDTVKRLLNSQVVDTNNNNILNIGNNNNNTARLVNVKLSIECYVGDEEVVEFKQKIKLLEKYHNRIEIQTKDTFASSSEFEDLFSHLTPFKVNIRSQCRSACVDNETQFKFDCVNELAHGLDKCLSHLILNNRKTLRETLDVNALEMQVGNLVTPFLFVTTNTSSSSSPSSLGVVVKNVKTKIKFAEKKIQVIANYLKYEIAFNAIDQIICCDDRVDHMFVYIPMKRFPIIYDVYDFDDDNLDLVDDLIIPR
jgi:hypothetical protein